MMGDMMPLMMDKKDPESMRKVMPRMIESMVHEQIKHMMLNMMPRMMDGCFSQMDFQRCEFTLTHCRGMLDQMKEKYVAEPAA